MAYLDGTQGPGVSRQFQAHLQGCVACRREVAALLELCQDLEWLGDRTRRQTSPVELVGPVLLAVRQRDAAVSTTDFGKSYGAKWRWWLAATSLAAALLITWFGPRLVSPEKPATGELPIARSGENRPLPNPTPDAGDHRAPTETYSPSKQRLELAKKHLPETTGGRPSGSEGLEATVAPQIQSVTIQDVINARKQALTDPAARARLRQMASLTPDAAREIAQNETASPEAVAGAAQALSTEEAQAALLRVVGHYPDRAYLRYALVQQTQAQPAAADTPKITEAQLSTLRDLDEDNALVYYLEALSHLEAGDVAGALTALETASRLDKASAYTLEAALAREQSLVAGGMDPQAARVATAFTAGDDEYGVLCDLGNKLLQYGRYYAESGDLATAQRIAEATQQFGQQLDDSALFAQERLAGLDIQRAAIDILEGIYEALGSGDGIETLVAQTMALVNGFQEWQNFFNNLDEVISEATDDRFVGFLADLILRQGDLNILDYL
ncbi:MAG: zf-HC2 domain-containing protein [Candidatus Hydrogenedentes bacterium]|nr:zf-HC2 domain-containing protein [Candidatus Hydrogenedentota bacterium]